MTKEIRQGEQRELTFTVREDKLLKDVSSATFELNVQNITTEAVVITKEHADFDLTSAVIGEVKTTITAIDTNMNVGCYYAEFKTTLTDGRIIKYPFYLSLRVGL